MAARAHPIDGRTTPARRGSATRRAFDRFPLAERAGSEDADIPVMTIRRCDRKLGGRRRAGERDGDATPTVMRRRRATVLGARLFARRVVSSPLEQDVGSVLDELDERRAHRDCEVQDQDAVRGSHRRTLGRLPSPVNQWPGLATTPSACSTRLWCSHMRTPSSRSSRYKARDARRGTGTSLRPGTTTRPSRRGAPRSAARTGGARGRVCRVSCPSRCRGARRAISSSMRARARRHRTPSHSCSPVARSLRR